MGDQSDRITIKEAAAISGVGPNTVRGWYKRGILKYRKWGGEYRLSRAEVEAYRDQGMIRAPKINRDIPMVERQYICFDGTDQIQCPHCGTDTIPMVGGESRLIGWRCHCGWQGESTQAERAVWREALLWQDKVYKGLGLLKDES